MGVKAVKRARQNQELRIKKLYEKSVPALEQRVEANEDRLRKMDRFITQVVKDDRTTKKAVNEWHRFIILILFALIIITGFNTGYIIMKIIGGLIC